MLSAGSHRSCFLDYNLAMRKWFYTLVLLFAAYFVYTHREELQLLLDILGRGDWSWMVTAVVVQLMWIAAIALGFYVTYLLVGIRERFLRMVPLTVAANFVNVVAPSYGLGVLAVLITDGQQRDLPAAKVSTAAVLYLVYDYIASGCVVIAGLIWLSRRDVLDTVLISASAFVLTITVVLVVLTFLGLRSPVRLGKTILWLVRGVNRILRPILKRDVVETEQAQIFAGDISDGLRSVRKSPGRVVLPLLVTLTQKILMMTILFLVSVAFHRPLYFDTLIAGFTTSYLFTIFSITPSGVGFVEGALTLYLRALGVPLATSAVISLAYRGIIFWLTLSYGLIAVRWIGYSRTAPKPEPEQDPQESLDTRARASGTKTLPTSQETRMGSTDEELEKQSL